MYKEKKILAIIPARGGSKGVPGKNIKPLAGTPLIGWTIDAAKQSNYIDEIVISTDSPEIQQVVTGFNLSVPELRPSHLATDTAKTIDVVLYTLLQMDANYDFLVLLQPTSPLRTSDDIDAAIELCINQSKKSLVSVAEVDKSPFWMFHLNNDLTMEPLIKKKDVPARRQDSPRLYQLNGAIYIVETQQLFDRKVFFDDSSLAYVMPEERSIDIDTELDFKLAELFVGFRTEHKFR